MFLEEKLQIIEFKLVDYRKIVYFYRLNGLIFSINDNKNEEFLSDRSDNCKQLRIRRVN
jgi:hypothetical protein